MISHPSQPDDMGDYGGGTPTQRQALQRIEQRAMLNGWPEPSDELKQAMVNRQVRIAIDPASSPRDAARSFSALVKVSKDKDASDTPLVAIQNNVSTGPTPQEVAEELMDNDEFRAWQYAQLKAKVK